MVVESRQVTRIVIAQEPLWLQIALLLGALATFVGAVTTFVLAARYGRKANVSIDAAAHERASRTIVAVHPSIRAVGVFSLRIEADSTWVTVTEVLRPFGGTARDSRQWINKTIFATDADGKGGEEGVAVGEERVAPGETVSKVVLFDVGHPPVELLGWRVSCGVEARRAWSRTGVWVWADSVFVPAPV